MRLEPINPQSLGAPSGYSNGMLSEPGGRLLFLAGQVGRDGQQGIVGEGFAAQFRQALENLVSVVRAAGGEPAHIGSLTIFVTDRGQYLSDLDGVGEGYRAVMGRHFPAMALVEVSGLVEAGAVVEVQGLAVVP
jgi:enamine deaminase RidA (YjgF/YER057c/UK114 family)